MSGEDRSGPSLLLTLDELVERVARPAQARSAVLLVGPPAAGKSSIAERLRARGYVRYSMDLLRARLLGDEGAVADRQSQELVRKTFRAELEKGLAAGERVLVDNLNFDARTRKPTLQRIRDAGYTDVILLILKVPLEECRRRNNARTRVVNDSFLCMVHATLFGSGFPVAAEGSRIVLEPSDQRDVFKVAFLDLVQ